ncbi:LbtU family siderophore porin [Candidatus Thiothrix sp. Deng01]|uniref:LbtU family siderophore porin n=1 Tax=Candidatus Thiothrix phosphatis TaxID=3112415 RepID=A0ABU6CZS6_9GAMM|nr:LbtU family siderophore porin [Candidatus Thiothrix sp. Deng01]MEB4591574.1 LbtU family siderophore porin [Candidatus Thiothrix sp. Deng01]
MKKQILAGMIGAFLSVPSLAAEVSEQLEITGTIELEYGASRGDSGNEYGTALATGALGATIKPNDKFDITTTMLYEEDLHGVATPMGTDEAFVAWHALPDAKLDIHAGRQYLPFGSFDTAMVSDPLTLELGETRLNRVLKASTQNGAIHAAGYVFAGEATEPGSDDQQGTGFGLRADYATEQMSAGVDYLSNLAESDGLDGKNNSVDKIPAISLHGSAQLGRFKLIGEHLTAIKSFQPGDVLDEDGNSLTVAAKPSATHLEANYDLHNDRTVALAWNQTKEAEEIGLAKEYYGATYRQPIYKGISGALELIQSKQYTGEQDKALTAQIAYEF